MAEKTYKEVIESKRKEMLSALLESMENDPTAWQKGWFSVSQIPQNGLTGKKYRGLNVLFLYGAAKKKGFEDPRWVTYNQAHELGATIKAGEKASSVFFYREYDKATKRDFDPQTIADLSTEEKRAYYEENVRNVLKYSAVFNAEQCDNFPELKKQEMSDAELQNSNKLVNEIINNSEAPIHSDGGDSAYYNPITDSIHIPEFKKFKSMNSLCATILHEIAHSTGHATRLNRDLTGVFGSQKYALEELRAELSSVFMQVDLGINLAGAEIANHAAYCRDWLTAIRDDPMAFYKAVTDADKICKYISTKYLKNEIENTREEKLSEEVRATETSQSGKKEEQQFTLEEKPQTELSKIRALAEEKAMTEGIAYVVIEWSESPKLEENTLMTFATADKVLQELNEIEKDKEGYFKTKLHIVLPQGQEGEWYNDCRFDIGDEASGGLLRHITDFASSSLVKDTARKEIEKFLKDLKVCMIKEQNGNEAPNESDTQTEVVIAVGNAATAPITAEEVVVDDKVNGKKSFAVWRAAQREKRLSNIEKNIPQEMKDLPNWCAFSSAKDEKGGYKKKIWDCNCVGAKRWAKSNDPTTWASFSDALDYARKNGCDGLSFALTPESGMFCVDLDDCKTAGKYTDTAWGVYNVAKQTYCERSVSGEGLHFFGKKAPGVDFSSLGNKNADSTFEYYDNSRFMSVTGDIFMKSKSELRVFSASDKLISIIKGQLPVKQELKPVQEFHNNATDEQVIEIIRKSKKAAEFDRMFAGEDICGDRNRTDLKMMNILGFFTRGDAEQMKRIFESSGLYRAGEKSRGYIDRTIQKALGTLHDKVTNFGTGTNPPPTGIGI